MVRSFRAAALAFAGPYAQTALKAPAARLKISPLLCVGALYVGIAFFVAIKFLPAHRCSHCRRLVKTQCGRRTFSHWPACMEPLRRPSPGAVILSWRLYPNIKISMDGRYETTYRRIHLRAQQRLLRSSRRLVPHVPRVYKVDFVILEFANGAAAPGRFNRARLRF